MISNNLINFFAQMAIIFPAFLIALTFHEFSHAFVATILGDDTAKKQGRLTLNPLAHLDFWGTIFLLFFRIGWAKPVPFNIHNFKRPKLYSILTALAGPVSNLILAYLFFVLLKFLPQFGFSLPVTKSLSMVFEASAYINVMLGVFNLMPIPPLDGSHLIIAFLYEKFPNAVVWIYRYSMMILLAIFILPFTRGLLMKLINTVLEFIRSLVF